jgi:hypothetical protein
MYLPEKLKADFIKRIEDLIVEGKQVQSTFKKEVETHKSSFGMSDSPPVQRIKVKLDRVAFAAWKTKCVNLADKLLSVETGLSKYLDFRGIEMSEGGIEIALGYLTGLQDIVTKDFLSNVGVRIEAEVASDYMGQAEDLLAQGTKGQHDHVPAAVLSGAVLEKSLRTLCSQQSPPIPLQDRNRKRKMMNVLIDDLKDAGLYNENKAKQLRAWAAVRNAAAHGEFNKFDRKDVESMLKAIGDFLADYLP